MTPHLLLPTRLADIFAQQRRARLPMETGGFLVGVRRGPHIEVTAITDQGPGDIATPTSFERRCPSHQARIDAAWRSSGHYASAVGDWHSHPWGDGSASNIDHSAWRTMARGARMPMIGIITIGDRPPSAFLSNPIGDQAGHELELIEAGGDTLVYAANATAGRRRHWWQLLGRSR